MNINKILDKYNPTFPNHYKQLLYVSHELKGEELLNYLTEILNKGGIYIACEISISSDSDDAIILVKENLDDFFEKWLDKTLNFIFQTKRPKPNAEKKQFAFFFESYSLFNFNNFLPILANFNDKIIYKKKEDIYFDKKVYDFFEKIFRDTILKNNNIRESSYEIFFIEYLNNIDKTSRINQLFILIQRNIFETFAFSTKKNKISTETQIAIKTFEEKFIKPKINYPNPARENIINYLLIKLILEKDTNKVIPQILSNINSQLLFFLQKDSQKNTNNEIKKHLNFILKLNQLGFRFESKTLVDTIKHFIRTLNHKIEEFKSSYVSYEYHKGYYKIDNVQELIQIFDYSVIIFTKIISQIETFELNTILTTFFDSINNFNKLKTVIEKDSHIKSYFSLKTFIYREEYVIKSDHLGSTIKIDLPPFFEGFIPKNEYDNELGNNLLILNDRIFKRHFTRTKSAYLSTITKSEYFLLNRYSICHPLIKFELFFINQVFQKLGLKLFFPFQKKSQYIKEKFESIDLEARSNVFFHQPIKEIGELTKKYRPKLYEDLSSYFEEKSDQIYNEFNNNLRTNKIIRGKVLFFTNQGFAVGIEGILGFLPFSQTVNNSNYLNIIGLESDLEIINLDNRNIILSQKTIFDAELLDQRKKIISKLQKGFIVKGVVKNITPYGAFIDLGGIDGLIHISDLSWCRITKTEDFVKLDQEVNVVILDFNEEKEQISLGLKQLQPHPWDSLDKNIKIGDLVKGKIIVIAEYGAFIEIAPCVEGLIHITEMSWSENFRPVQDFLKVGDTIEAVILTLDSEERKMSLSIKNTPSNQWDSIIAKYPINSLHNAKILLFKKYGVFVELEVGINGFIHISNLTWLKTIKHPSEFCEIGKNIEVVILEIDNKKHRISLGHKQLTENPFDLFEESLKVGSIHYGTIIKMRGKSGIISIKNGIEAICPERHLTKKDGLKLGINNKSNFKVIEYNKAKQKIIVSIVD